MAREKRNLSFETEVGARSLPQKAILSRTDMVAYSGRVRKWLDSYGFTGQ